MCTGLFDKWFRGRVFVNGPRESSYFHSCIMKHDVYMVHPRGSNAIERGSFESH